MRTPPGMSESDFAAAIADFKAVVGNDWVFTSDDDLEPYRDAYSILWNEPEERIASAAMAPFSADEVQAIMRIANARRVPLYPISTGKNLGYGGAAPVDVGQRRARSQAHEPHARDRRAQRVPCWSSRASAISISTATFRTRA